MTRVVEITAPSRLHFGMWAFGDPRRRQFGGVGAMIDQPGVRLQFSAASELSARGPQAERVLEFAGRCLAAEATAKPDEPAPRVLIDVLQTARDHVGLGSGTQLGLAVVMGLDAWRGHLSSDAQDLSRRVGRGLRSAIGTHGFQRGGMLLEAGKLSGDQISPLLARADLPPAWRFLIITPRTAQGLSGEPERKAFAQLPAVSAAATDAMCGEVLLELLPAACEARFERFSESLYRYGQMAGMCFAAQHDGNFARADSLQWIERMRQLGVVGVGQTSWGPTVFAALPSDADARQLSQQLQLEGDADWQAVIATPNRHGAAIRIVDAK